jgi:hypothetical protein
MISQSKTSCNQIFEVLNYDADPKETPKDAEKFQAVWECGSIIPKYGTRNGISIGPDLT